MPKLLTPHSSILNSRRGAAALELLVALAVLVFSVSASIMVVFGNQSVSVDTETNSAALLITEKVLEEARAASRNWFNSVLPESFNQPPYITALSVLDLTQCKKQAVSETTWNVSPSRAQKISLSTVFSDIKGALALGGDCGSDPPASGWDNPNTLGSVNLNPSGLKATDVDTAVLGGVRWAFLSSISGSGPHNDFWVIDVSDPASPFVATSLDTESCQSGSGPNRCGLNALDIAGNYAYVANTSSTDSLSSDEFLVIDIGDPLAPVVVGSATLGVTPTCPTYCPGGAQAIHYYGGRVYVGTHRIGGRELHVFDVSDPSSPMFLGSAEIDHNINAIAVRDGLAYLATSADAGELLIYDVSDPADIVSVGAFDAAGAEDGQALYLLGNKLYLGRDRTPSARRDFYIIDVSDPANPYELGSKNLGLNPNTAVSGIVVSGPLVFIATTNQTSGFHVWDVSDPADIKAPSACNLYNYSEKATGIDFADNLVFVSNESNDALRIIEDNVLSSCS